MIQTIINDFQKTDFNLPQYRANLKAEMLKFNSKEKPLYIFNTWSKVARIVYDIFSCIIFPIAIARFLHRLVVRLLLPSTHPSTRHTARQERKIFFDKLDTDPNYVAKRFTVLVNGKKVNAMIFGKRETINNRRWMLFANPSGHVYEQFLGNKYEWTKQNLEALDCNCLFYNYPGTGDGKEKWTSRRAMVNAHQAMRLMLEDKNKGMGAKTIIEFAVSMGGGVVLETLSSQEIERINKLKKEKDSPHRVFVFHQTFSNLCLVPKGLKQLPSIIRYFSDPLVRIFGWNLGAISKARLNFPSIIIQTAKTENPLSHIDIEHDEVISGNSSLAYKILKRRKKPGYTDDKLVIIGTLVKHVDQTEQLLARLKTIILKSLECQ